ncbi:quinone oxidoreductase family protein [Vineibacter terrae]|uniref:quinone oxidoreductase family protein n=1 Tax=Vineibacter terrae TaxID=2586908 RepID=UPI002E33DA09|nr:zinc-binding dehydrogenase [Vineibacter terrae]HEX2886681.1 zinc-binding dehydrogenase [Vineibacter terrae]
MRAIVLKSPNGRAEDLVVADVPEPSAGPGEVVVAVAFGGCNFADTMMHSGTYPHPKGYPIVAGLELSGHVAAVGPGVTGFKIGDRVAAFSEGAGGFAERCVVPAERLIRLPDQIGLDVGAAFPIQSLTAWNILHTVSTTRPGQTILVHAVGGGLGLQVTQLAVMAGARVIGTVGTAGKEQRALDYGATQVVNRTQADFVAAALALTGGKGVDKVVDSTGASILDRSFEAIRTLGHIVSVGEAEGKPYTNLWDRLVPKSLTFTRFHLGHIDFASRQWHDGVDAVVKAIAAGTLKMPIAEIFPFERVADMYARLGSRQVSGKLVLTVQGA